MNSRLTPATFTKLSPRPLAKYSTRELRFSGIPAVVRQRETYRDWQAVRMIGQPGEEVKYFESWEEAIRWALEDGGSA